MRPYIGIVSVRTESRSPGQSDFLNEFMPRSDRARLIDFVKFSGVVDGSRKSTADCRQRKTSTQNQVEIWIQNSTESVEKSSKHGVKRLESVGTK